MKIKYSLNHYFTVSHPLLGSGLRNYLQLLSQNFLNIDPRFALKLIFSLLTAIAWTPFRVFESVFLFRKIRNTKVSAPIIILGHPRSGTTYLHYLLAKDPQLAYTNTYEVFMPRMFFFFGKYIGKMMEPLMPKKRAMDNLSMGAYKPTMDEFALANLSMASWCHGFYFPNKLEHYFSKYVTFSSGGSKERAKYKKAHLYFIRKAQLKNPGKTLIIKSAATTCRIKELLEIFPDAHFVHIYRDPSSVYLSTERLYEKILPLFGFHKVADQEVQNFIISSYREYHQKWFSEKSLIPKERLIEFPFEEFVKDPMKYIYEMYSQFGMVLSEEALARIRSEIREHKEYRKNLYHSLPADISKRLQIEWQFCYHNWGYTID